MRLTYAEVDLNKLRHNYRQIKNISNSKALMPIVKAHAYGHGMIECSKILREEGADFLGVAYIMEAIKLRKYGDNGRIMVLVPELPDSAEHYISLDITPAVSTIEMAKELSRFAVKSKKTSKIHLYIDTGMSRDGLRMHEVNAFLDEFKNLANIEIEGICTHFASSPNDFDFTEKQYNEFIKVVSNLKSQGYYFDYIHAANSGAILNHRFDMLNLLRPGIMNYGYTPETDLEEKIDLLPIMSVKSKIIEKRKIKSGESVGYDRMHISDRDTIIATIPIGYGDGYPKLLSNKAEVIINGKKYPIRGSVCMDEIMIDIFDDDLPLGTEVILLGKQAGESINAHDLAEITGSIPYEITTTISGRVPRIYSGES